tara:strand:- start:397 stop:768 length:372 start_codon:yes stop_codon:yes gene_type:complete
MQSIITTQFANKTTRSTYKICFSFLNNQQYINIGISNILRKIIVSLNDFSTFIEIIFKIIKIIQKNNEKYKSLLGRLGIQPLKIKKIKIIQTNTIDKSGIAGPVISVKGNKETKIIDKIFIFF